MINSPGETTKTRIVMAVTNDLSTDQRVQRVARTLVRAGAEVVLVGRILHNSQAFSMPGCQIKRFRLPVTRGALFYGLFNVRLFFYLLGIRKYDALVSNDLDTLLACFMAARLRRKPIVYDSHEYFTESPEIVHKPFVKGVWRLIEKIVFPHLSHVSTVCESIARLYEDQYKVKVDVIRNIPEARILGQEGTQPSVGVPEHLPVVLYQGVLNIGRGIELMIDAVRELDNIVLVIAGDGDISRSLRERSKDLVSMGRVVFTGRLSPGELNKLTPRATLGLSLEEDLGLNYRYALPNKLFSYIHAQVPVLVSDLPEMKKIVEHYQIGEILHQRTPSGLATQINEMINDSSKVVKWRGNLRVAANELSWEKEEIRLLNLYHRAGIQLNYQNS
jgi:glycosyltransferase involved in cell wall biosynthesis